MEIVAAIIIPIIFGVVGGFLAGDAVTKWYPTLKKPSYAIPIWLFTIIGIVYYIICGFIIYRLLVYADGQRTVSFVLLFVMMAYNEIWNYLLFGLKSPWVGFVSLIPYSIVVIMLFVALISLDRLAAYALLPYLIWLIYDFAWIYGLWKMNPPTLQ